MLATCYTQRFEISDGTGSARMHHKQNLCSIQVYHPCSPHILGAKCIHFGEEWLSLGYFFSN